MMPAWKRFVLEHGWKAWVRELAAVLERTPEELQALRSTKACRRTGKVKHFAELFALWHGRPPRDDEWPRPRKGHRSSYEWQAPELALLASLVGRVGKRAAARILSARLRKVTGDRRAVRTQMAVQMAMNNRLGMHTTDVVGGVTVAAAGREIGSYAMVYQAIERKHLKAYWLDRHLVIPHAAWRAWKARRVFPPAGFVRLASLKRPLGIRSDKLSEWARMGYVPTALRCNPYGERMKSTQFGTWYMDGAIARRLVADRRAGRPMPWWGKPELGNLGVTFALWQKRKHPAACATCRQIWGRKGPPRSFDEYVERYHPLEHGVKRHLTRPWSNGMTMNQVAAYTGRSWGGVRNAVLNGMLQAAKVGNTLYIARTEATRWKWRNCPCGADAKSWVALRTARKLYGFTLSELRGFIAKGELKSKIGTAGPMLGITYVARAQCARLREREGFTLPEAARRAGIRIERFKALLEGVNWRGAKGIPLETVQAVVKRLDSRHGYTTREAADRLEVTEGWIFERVRDGTIRVTRSPWDRRRLYITGPMLERLRRAKRKPVKPEDFGEDWLFLGQAAKEAGVSTSMICIWAGAGELERRQSHLGWRYHRAEVRARARAYWKKPRLRRAVPPEWLLRERARPASNESSYNHLRIAA